MNDWLPGNWRGPGNCSGPFLMYSGHCFGGDKGRPKNGPGFILFGSVAAPAMPNAYVVMPLDGQRSDFLSE